ncbi:hypothetical protein [Marinobacter nauticus]|uniref:hypothetical protein n=1 Tax=Marinobacter nauticus TaxID=2743 RepID=UPI001C56E584|nr:hypothetical protein [Marinobacter nauticus]MBW3196103.1 hypothetical protein [Marinobacter nauticus]MBY6181513.1 hypothetical protein [Marinobacter nauticus]
MSSPAYFRLMVSVFVVPMAMLSGCASYYTHYAMFPAENSAGETRQVRVNWQSAEYPEWWPGRNQATTMKLETQCSDRVWRIADSSHDSAGDCGDGIRACGDPSLDVLAATGSPATGRSSCLTVKTPQGGGRVADVGSRFELLVSCQPARATLMKDGEEVNVDYIRPSAVAYTVYARKVPRGSLNARLPDFDETQCLED